MSKKIKIIVAVCSVVVLLIVGIIIFSAVNKNKADKNPENGSNEVPVAGIVQETTSEPESAVVTTENQTQQTTTAPVTTTAAPTQNILSMSTAEIVDLYNSSVNRVKSEASSITRNYKKLGSLSEYLQLPALIQTVGSAAINQFVKGTDTPESWSSKDDINLVFPVGGTDYSSHMTADMVESASCVDTGDSYKIEIKLYDDKITSPAKGEGYAGVFNTVTASTFDDISIPTVTFNKVDVKGINGSISCTINKSTKRVTEITFRNADVLSLGVKVVFSNIDAQFALDAEENYSIQY